MNKGLFFLMVCVLASCRHPTARESMKETSGKIVQALLKHDSLALNKLFVDDPAIDLRDVNHRRKNAEEGYQMCGSLSASDTSQFKITKMPLSRTIYEVFVEIPFVNPSTHETRGKIKLEFANWWGFKKAVNMDVVNFDEIDKAYNEHTSRPGSDTIVVEAAKTIMRQNNIPIHPNQ